MFDLVVCKCQLKLWSFWGGVGGADQASEFLHPRADVQFFLKFICMWVLHSVFDLHVSAVTIICKCLPDCVMNTYQA